MSKLKSKENFDQKVKNGMHYQILEGIFKSGKYLHHFRIIYNLIYQFLKIFGTNMLNIVEM
jgi:hypothetical protein